MRELFFSCSIFESSIVIPSFYLLKRQDIGTMLATRKEEMGTLQRYGQTKAEIG